MNNLDIDNYGVQELNAVEMKKTDGGIGPWAGIIFGILIAEALDRGAAQDFKDGWKAAASK